MELGRLVIHFQGSGSNLLNFGSWAVRSEYGFSSLFLASWGHTPRPPLYIAILTVHSALLSKSDFRLTKRIATASIQVQFWLETEALSGKYKGACLNIFRQLGRSCITFRGLGSMRKHFKGAGEIGIYFSGSKGALTPPPSPTPREGFSIML